MFFKIDFLIYFAASVKLKQSECKDKIYFKLNKCTENLTGLSSEKNKVK